MVLWEEVVSDAMLWKCDVGMIAVDYERIDVGVWLLSAGALADVHAVRPPLAPMLQQVA